jgi:XTP/dITP diphosphohydrolase
MKLVFATHNLGKLQEVRELLAPDYEVIGLDELGDHDEIEETAMTLEGNAWIKARTVWQKHGLSCFSDDTGLEIAALDNAPGVFSARYAGPSKDADANMDKVLLKLEGKSNRKARFRTAVALVFNGNEHLFEGTVNGEISTSRSGSKGFGYDPIFTPHGYTESFAEMDAKTKNEISHRALAIKKLVAFLKAH